MQQTLTMRATRIAALAAATLVAIGAHAGTTYLYDAPVSLPGSGVLDFMVGSFPVTFQEGAGILNTADEGIGFLSGPGYFTDFALTDGIVGPAFIHTIDLTTPGAYTFTYIFANSNATIGDQVALTVDVSSVPEPETLAMLLTGLLAVGVAARRTLRKSDSMSGAVAA
jgi:hypothetical protein